MSGLLRAEARRFRSRRFIRLLVVLGVLGLLAGVTISYFQFEKTSPQTLVRAEERLQEQLALDMQFRDDCLREYERQSPPGTTAEDFCPVSTAENYGGIETFIEHPPFDVADAVPAGAIAVGVVTAALLFLIGATYVGAEWSSRSMVALLFWEPRRLRVVVTKALVALAGGLIVAVLAQALWLGAGFLLGSTRGTTTQPPGFWGDLLAQQGRVVLLGLVAVMLGFGMTNLFRNTGATLGISFVYLIVVENAVRVGRPSWQQYLLTDNAVALVSKGGYRIFLGFDERTQQSKEMLLGTWRGGLTLGAVCLVVLVVGALLFRRRDLT